MSSAPKCSLTFQKYSKSAINQQFYLPYDVNNYVIKNTKNPPEFYFKLYSTCKYFFTKIKVIPCNDFRLEMDGGGEYYYGYKRQILSKDLLLSSIFKLHVNQSLNIGFSNIPLSLLIPKNIFVPTELDIQNQTLTLKEFQSMVSKAKRLRLISTLLFKNELIVSVEEIMKLVLNVYDFHFTSKTNTIGQYTSKTSKIISKLKTKFTTCYFYSVPNTFDAQDYIEFVKNNNKSSNLQENLISYAYGISFDDNVAAEFVKNFHTVIINDRELWKPNMTNLKIDVSWSNRHYTIVKKK